MGVPFGGAGLCVAQELTDHRKPNICSRAKTCERVAEIEDPRKTPWRNKPHGHPLSPQRDRFGHREKTLPLALDPVGMGLHEAIHQKPRHKPRRRYAQFSRRKDSQGETSVSPLAPLVGVGPQGSASTRWQATSRLPSGPTVRGRGISVRHLSMAKGHRGAKGHPVNTLVGVSFWADVSVHDFDDSGK